MDFGSVSFGLEAFNSQSQARSDPYNLSLDRGVCDFDVKHNLVANALYTLPFHGNRVISGWQVGGLVSARSGMPFGPTIGFDNVGLNNPAGQPAERPNLVAGKSNNPKLGRITQWFDPTAFALPPAGELGNLGRNTMVGPRFANLDLSLIKNTRFRESMNLEFRAEAFNILNHPNFGLPNQALYTATGVLNPSAGLITRTNGDGRQVQFALKFSF